MHNNIDNVFTLLLGNAHIIILTLLLGCALLIDNACT